jgi:hypothetical protein
MTMSATPTAGPHTGRRASSTVPSLETLPFEIQRLVLAQAPNWDTLGALVHASPQLYRVYVRDRPRILRDFVEQTLDGILLDAHAACISGTDQFQRIRNPPMLWEFVDNYQHRRTTTSASDLVAELTLSDLLQLARFHRSVIEPLTSRYATWALAALSSSPEKWPLSGTERRRIQRALYHYQIYCNVCGSRGEGRSSQHHIEQPLQCLRVLSVFPGWQVEEVLCIHEFAKDTYGGVFDRVAWDLDEIRNPRYQDVDLADAEEELLLFSELAFGRLDPPRRGAARCDADLGKGRSTTSPASRCCATASPCWLPRLKPQTTKSSSRWCATASSPSRGPTAAAARTAGSSGRCSP